MKLSLKAIRLVIEALEQYEEDLDRQLKNERLSEDEISDLVNDRQYLAAIKSDFEKHREELTQQRGQMRAGA
jgi:hypothetical protein